MTNNSESDRIPAPRDAAVLDHPALRETPSNLTHFARSDESIRPVFYAICGERMTSNSLLGGRRSATPLPGTQFCDRCEQIALDMDFHR